MEPAETRARVDLPTGTVTFFFSDIEGSTRLLEGVGEDQFREVVEQHVSVIRSAIENHGGVEIATEGDAFFAAFSSAPQAAAAAVETQTGLAACDWPKNGKVRVRIGLHTGEGRLGGDDYLGLDVHRGARIAGVGYGCQVLMSGTTRSLVADSLPEGTRLLDLGEHRLKDLSRPERLYQLVIPGMPSEFPTLRSVDARPNNLPVQLTSFVGRERELEELREILAETRLLTLTGPGGMGKTRLSIHLGAEAGDHFPDGVFFVGLATVTDPDDLAPTVAQSLGLAETRGEDRPAIERVVDYLRERCLLLILDNLEQIPDCAPVVSEILASTNLVKLVATSRSALRVYGESEYPVPPLPLPDPTKPSDLEAATQYEGVLLFAQRAVAVRPDFKLTSQNAAAVAEICARLDGLPLAIELAAARIRVLSPEALLARLSERLKVLIGGARDLPERQQTLRQAIEWSYGFLDESDKGLFSRLAVFTGQFALEEAEKVARDDVEMDVLDGIASLVEKSLLRIVEESSAETRYFMLETIRELALEKLGASAEDAEVRRRHALAYLELVEELQPQLITAERSRFLDRLERDHENIRSALEWAVENGERDTALRLATAAWRFWQMRGHLNEARKRIEEALSLSGEDDRTALRAKTLQAAGGVGYWQGDQEAAGHYYDEALAIWKEVGDKAGIAGALYDSAFRDFHPEAMREAMTGLEEALGLYQEIGDVHGEGNVRWGKGLAHLFNHEFEDAERELEQSLGIFREAGDAFMTMWTLHELGLTELESGRYEEAFGDVAEALRLAVDAGDVTGMLFELDTLSRIEHARGKLERAITLRAACANLQHSSGAGLIEAAREFTPGGDVVGGLTKEDFEQSWAEGEAMSIEEAVAYALEDGS